MNILGARRAMWYEGSRYIYENKAYNFDNWLLFWCVSDSLKYNFCQLISYLTQGFYGLTLSFQVPFQWTFFLGSVRGLNSIISQIFPFIPNMVNLTYPVRAGEVFGFDGLASWYTIFPWLASDFTFLGALVYMGLVGWLYMRCWIQVIQYYNPFAFTILVLLNIQYIFLIANNQLFIQRGEALATVVLVFVYCIYNKKFNFHNDEIKFVGGY